jgi:hypothetical protein
MTESQTAILTATAAAMIVIGCADVNAPLARSLQPPRAVSKTVGAPDESFSVPADRGFPPTKTYLTQFPWDTWVTLEATGSVSFTRQPPIPGASPSYTALYPGRSAGATGVVDPYGDPCVMSLIPGDGVTNMTSFGICGAAPKIDTVLSKTNLIPWIIRGPLPSKHLYNCSNSTDVCDATVPGVSTVRERPVPVALNKLMAVPRTIDTLHPTPVQFTGSITPDSITVQATKSAHPFHVNLWQWGGADISRDPVLTGTGKGPGCTSTLLCRYTPPESGRMILKVFVGGWEQTAYRSIECLTSEPDTMLNDSTNDFKSREDLLDLLVQSFSDSSSKAGWNAQHLGGWRREVGGVIWKLPNGGGFQFVPYDDLGASACQVDVPPSEFDLSHAPVPGATPYSGYHVHPNAVGDTVFGCDSIKVRGVWQKPAKSPNDPNASGYAVKLGAGPSGPDMDYVKDRTHKPEFIMEKDGLVWRIDPPTEDGASPHLTAFRAINAKTASQRRCTWVKRYQP